MMSRHDADIGLVRDMFLQAKDAAEIKHGDRRGDFLFEMDEFQMREFLWVYRQNLIENIKAADRALTATLHKECIDSGLISAAQWNEAIAPKLAALTAAIEPYREFSHHVMASAPAPLAPWAEYQRKLQLFAQTHGHWLPASAEQELRSLANLQPPELPNHADKEGRRA